MMRAVIRQSSPRYVVGRVSALLNEVLRTRHLNALMKGRTLRLSGRAWSLRGPVRGHYLVSSERGIFELQGQSIRQLLPFETFGLSIDNGNLFVALSIGPYSHVIAAKIVKSGPGQLELNSFRLLRTIEAKYPNERIHQIHARQGRLAIANTRFNSITVLESSTGNLIVDIFPFVDSTGFPIRIDQNHINSVYLTGDALLFTAHSAGKIGSFLGYISGGRVVAFPFPHRGVHDIVPTREGLIFSDTFGGAGKDFKGGGNVIFGGRRLLPGNKEHGFMIRGIAGTGNEMIVGHSNHGGREDRFKSEGSLLVFEDLSLKSVNPVPFSQVYDIVRLDGAKMDKECTFANTADLHMNFESALGPAAYEAIYHVLDPANSEFRLTSMSDLRTDDDTA
jgi:hypothetical protein